MPRDKRTYITLHDGITEHPKIEALTSDAFVLLITLWCWCSRNRSNGDVPETTWAKRGNARTRRELLKAGLAEPRPDGVYMHDYLEHQRSAEEIDELAKKRREAGSRGGLSTANARASAAANLAASDAANEWRAVSK